MFKWFGKKEPEKSPAAEAEAVPVQESASSEAAQAEEKTGFEKLKEAASLTSRSLMGRIRGLVTESEINDETIDEIEELLLRADVGLSTATDITDKLRKRKAELHTSDQLMEFLREEFERILVPFENANHLGFKPGILNIYLVVGVNGAGKTTFIGKLANRLIKEGRSVVIGAGDTFRAAAEEQLEIWAQRAGAGFVSGRGETKDPAAVIFEAIKQAKDTNADAVILDTAGRLQNKFNLMEELRKIYGVIQREQPAGASLESLLVVDATTGQNALQQAQIFKEAVSLSGVILTKLDGSAKGGIVLTIAAEHQLPVKMVGVGEKIDDLREFNARAFIDALFER